VTPLQLAHAIGGLANGGVWMKPHLVKEDKIPEPVRRGDINIDNLTKVIYGMYAVVNEGGTGSMARLQSIEMCGKTGSAQTMSNEAAQKAKSQGQVVKDNAWFVGFAPRQSPEVVVATLFEEGEHGNLAGPIVRDVIKAYFDKKARVEKLQQPAQTLAAGFGLSGPGAGGARR
jgi:penicillin-binding protein 2